MKNSYFLFIALAIVFQACSEDNDPANTGDKGYPIDWNAAADSSTSALISSFWNPSNKYFNSDSGGDPTFQYWPQAHALDVLTDAYTRTDDELYKEYYNQWYEGVKAGNNNGFLNVFYDDMQWNALAMLRAYNATNDEKFKTTAIELWNDIQTGWNDQAGGGIAWKKDQLYSKNACSNGTACILATRLYQQFGDEDDKEWALKIYDWEKENLFNVSNGAVYDNMDARTGIVQKDWIFTYNEGTFLGSALELYNITKEKGYLNDAVKTANYTINSLIEVNTRLLKDEGTGDAGLFKGIFIRYFTQLILHPDLDSATKKRYVQFITHNAETLWREGTNKQFVYFGTDWTIKPLSETGLNEQLSGNMLIEAMALLKKEGVIQ